MSGKAVVGEGAGRTVVVAMSGGVDSSVAASLLASQGFEVIGVTIRLLPCDDGRGSAKSCCGVDAVAAARAAAERIGVPHYVIDRRDEFRERVLRPAWEEYRVGRTPNPCSLCNDHLKFGDLTLFAAEVGAELVATGHYSIIERDDLDGKGVHLRRGADANKDQAYFLAGVSADKLARCLMPLGAMDKRQTRAMAAQIGLANAERQESQDACFGGIDGGFAESLRKLFGGEALGGWILDDSGRRLRRHEGIHNFTIGQRKGLGVALGKPAYVVVIDPRSGDVVVSADESKLLSATLRAKSPNWLENTPSEFHCQAQFRYRQRPVGVKVVKTDDGGMLVEFDTPARAVTPGQFVALFDSNLVLGGGWIE